MRIAPLAAAAFALVSCSQPAPAAPAPKPAMWKLADPDTTIYLFGTIHVLPENYAWRTKRFDAAVASAHELVLEIADQDDAAKLADSYKKLALSPGLPPLADRVAPDKRAALAKLVERSGLKPGQLDGLETWAAAITLGVALYRDVGATADNGVEKQIATNFKANGRRIEGLETTPQQLGYFDGLPEMSQRRLLTSIIEEADGSKVEFEKMLRAWSRGDTKAIAVTFDDELRISPDLAEILLKQRNARWTDWLQKRLDTPGTVMVAVGAGHLAGGDSVIALLKAKGLKAVRVQ